MRVSVISAALVAALVGYGSTIALVLAAAAALGATAGQTASWVFAICLVKAAGSAGLSRWTRIPMVLAWSTPGAALIAGSAGISMAEGVGAFLLAAVLILATGLIRPLAGLISALPASVASGMLAGVLLPFCLAVPQLAVGNPVLLLPIVAVFVAVRLWNPAFAVLAALGCGLGLAFAGGVALPATAWALPSLEFVPPEFRLGALLGLGVPLYLVTMASQNLPGFAVLQGAGFQPPVQKALTVTGLLSALGALFGAHTINMAAITAAICLGEEVEPDRARRWRVGVAYGAVWLALGLAGPVILAGLAVVPKEMVATIAGLALTGPLIGAMGSAFAVPDQRFTAAATLIVAASGISVWHVGGAFWALLVGLGLHLLAKLVPFPTHR
jgi:benzoate membrane transport protein